MAAGTTTRSLHMIKLVHTLVWAFFASATFLIPVCAWMQQFRAALILIATVFVEVLILIFNGFSCPLTGVAAQYTNDRRDNFDIYLPEWLARQNKLIFGLLYLFGILFTAALWSSRVPAVN
jgi:polyferredoxin